MNCPPSNPVAPTIQSLGLRKIVSIKPVARPVTPDASAQVWNALAEIGRQLQVLAGAHSQGNFVPSSPGPSQYAPDSPSVVELVNQFLLATARSGRSDRYLRALRNSLAKFNAGRAHKKICDVSVEEIEKWMHRPEWAARTQRGYVADVRTMFNFAVRRGLLKTNPAAGVELPVMENGAIEIHTPGQVTAVLNFERHYDPNICRALAVRYFAGLRSAEAERLEEKFIGEKFIEVTATNAKTRRRRLVTVQPNLRAWLDSGGTLPVRGNKSNVWRDFTKAMTRATGVPWHHNATRHSFCSYHLAQFQNAGKTALESGHSEAMLFAHYRELVMPDEAAAFWFLRPTVDAVAPECFRAPR